MAALKVGVVLIIVGIVLLVVGVFQWQTGLNRQVLTESEIRRAVGSKRVTAGQGQEVAGLTLMVAGVAVAGGGIWLYKKKVSWSKDAKLQVLEPQKAEDDMKK